MLVYADQAGRQNTLAGKEMALDRQPLDPQISNNEVGPERTLRPGSLGEFIGQKPLKENLSILIQAALKRSEALEHLLFYGPPGLGKTTLAHLLASEMGVEMISTTGPALERPSEIVGLLTSLKSKGILFIDEIHRIPRAVEEYLYQAMEDFRLDIMLDRGPAARSVQLNLAPFCLIGATTRVGLLTAPMRSRFGFMAHLEFYPEEDLSRLLTRSAEIMQVELSAEGVSEIARRSRGTPRIANRLLRRVRDFALVKDEPVVTDQVAAAALKLLRIDERGLDEMDRRLLSTIMVQFSGGPVGLGTIAAALGEEEDTIEDLLEPFLIQQGLIQRTRRGREATKQAYQIMGLDRPTDQNSLF
jgi:holliday junction DNA helicase RuvB